MEKENGKMNPFDDTPNKIPSLTAIRLKWGFRRFLYVAGVLLRSKHGPLYVGGLVAALALMTFSLQSLYAAWNPAKPILAPLALPGEPRPATALHIPMPVLEKTLNLTSDEKSKIKTIHDAFHSAEREITPSPRSGEVDPAVSQATRAKVADLEKQSEAQMEAALTPAQAALLPTLLADIQNMAQVGLPPPAYPDLNLTADQKQRLATVAENARTKMNKALADAALIGQGGGFTALRDNLERIQYATHKDALAILSASQQQTVAAHPPHPPKKGPHPPRHPGGPRPPHGPEPPAPEPPTE